MDQYWIIFNAFFFFRCELDKLYNSFLKFLSLQYLFLFYLLSLGLDKIISFISFNVFFLMYPSVGVPFVDHHSTIFVLSSFILFIIGIKKGQTKYYFFIPIFLTIGFLAYKHQPHYGILAFICFIPNLFLISKGILNNFNVIIWFFFSWLQLVFFFFCNKFQFLYFSLNTFFLQFQLVIIDYLIKEVRYFGYHP